MAIIKKVKLPDGTTHDVNDARITGIDNTPVQNSINVVTSGGVYDSIQSAVGDGIVIYDVEPDTSTAGTWKGTSSEIESLYDGLTIRYKVPIAGASTTTLNVNNLGAKKVYRSGSTKLTTNYAVGSYVLLYYSSLNGGCWEVYSDYDANTNTYVRQYQAGQNAAGTAPKYPLLARYNVTNYNGSYDATYARYHTDATVNTNTGEIEANGFIKTGGTSSQFLKADGSVDSNTYALASEIPNAQIQSDWNQTTTTAKDYIKNKPNVVNNGNGVVGINNSIFAYGIVNISDSKNSISLKSASDDGILITTNDGSDGRISLTASSNIELNTTGTNKAYYNNKEIATKNDIPTVDAMPTSGSTNAVSSGGVYTAIDNAQVWEPGTGTNSAVLKGSEGTAAGNYSTVEGYKSETGGSYTENSITFDTNDTTSGSYAHVEGRGNIASGALGAHAEGNKNLASGNCAHAEGGLNVASGNMSHAEGNRTLASGGRSHAEGTSTTASGASSHAEGTHTIASALDSHAEGQYTVAEGAESYVGGYYSKALGDLSNVYGFNSFGINYCTHAEGTTIAYGDRSHAENGCKGMEVLPIGTANATSYTSTFDEEWRSVRTAVGDTVFCNIIKASTIKQKQNSTDIMPIRIISASYSGDTLTFTVESTLSETALDGSVEYWINMSVAYGEFSHSENEGNISYGEGSHSEGEYTVAIGNFSHTEGIGTITNNVGEHAEGQYNKSTKTNTTYGNAGNTQHSIGIGTSSARKNAVEVMQNGDMYVVGVGNYDGTNFANADTLQESIPSVDNAPTSGSSNAVSSGGVYTELLDVVHQGDLIGSATYEDSGTVVDLTDYVREDNLKTINNQSLIGSGNITISGGSGGGGEANVIEAITFNGASVPVTNKTAAITATIPAAVTESTVSGWGFTKNTGTYSKPSGGIPKTDLASAVQTSLGKADTALQSYTETDPTVPAWAKAATKPTYTAAEVGALPNTTVIPATTSALTNDSGFKKITISSSEPTSSDGVNGDIWIVI